MTPVLRSWYAAVLPERLRGRPSRSRRTVAALLVCVLMLGIVPASAMVVSGGSGNPISWLISQLGDLKDRLARDGAAQTAAKPAVWSPPGRTAEVAQETPKPPGKRVKEVVGRRSQYSAVYALDDGRFQAEISAEPVNYRDAKGAWQKIDTSVEQVSEPGFVAGNDSTGFVTRFGDRTDRLVTIKLGQRSLTFGLAGPARAVTPRIAGSKVTYAGLWPDADLVYEITPEGVRELIVLHRQPAAGTAFTFTVAGAGLTAKQNDDGSMTYAGSDGAPVFTMPKPFMTDATDDAASPYGKRYSEKVTKTLSGATLTVTPDVGWLADKGRTWPVVIDPTVNVQPDKTASKDTTIAENAPDTIYGQSWNLTAGTMFAGPSRSLIAFNLAGAVPAGVRIDSAELGLYFDHVIYTGGNAPVRVPLQMRRVTGLWDEATANWLAANALGGEVVATNALEVGQVNAWHTYPITALAQSWLDGTYANHGVMVQAVDETETIIGGPIYASGEPAEDGLHVPKLTITYGQPAVNLLQPEFIHATGAELSWSHYVDPSAAPGDNLVEYQVHRSSVPVFAPSASTLIAPLPEGVNAYTDSTATPADPGGPDRPVYYTIAVKRADGQLIASQQQRVLLPRAGYVTQLLRAQHVAADTTLVACEPTTGHDRVGFAPGRAQLVTGFQYIDRNLNYGTTRTLMKFDTSGIPATARVSAAELGMWRVADNGNATYLNVHALTRGFDEATASWNKASSAVSWTTPGGDYGPSLSTTQLVTTPYASWSRFPVTAAVQSWVSAPANNHGFITRMAQEPNKSCGSNGEGATFLASESAEQSLRPYLKVSYADPTGTYYAASTPISLNPGETVTIPVSVTNSTSATWAAASTKLSYWWKSPDGTDVTTTDNRLFTALPADLGPGQTVTVNAQVKGPSLSGLGNKAEAFTLAWDLYDTVANNWKSSSSQLPQLPQQIRVEDPTSDLLGLEKFYSYAGKNTGGGGTLMNNVYAGNAVWSYNAFSNPSRGTATFARMTYNSLDTSASSMGFGWSLQTSTVQRLGSQLSFHPPGQKWPTQVRATDGDGTTNVWVLDTHGRAVPDCTASTCDYTHPRGVHLYLQQTGSTDPTRTWVFTKPDRTQFFFDEDGFQSAIVDNNGNTMSFTYERRKSNNKPTKFLRYITDPSGRRTLTLDYFDKGEPYTYIDDNTWQEVNATTLTNPFIIDNVKSMTDISGRTVTFTYTGKGLMAKMVDGFGSAQPKVFGFRYDATQGNKNVKLIEVVDPRGNDTDLSYFPPSDPQNKWKLQNLTDRRGFVTTYAYTDPDGPQGGLINATVTDAENHATAYQLDGYGRPFQITNAKNEPTKMEWDGDHNVIRLEEANGAVSTWAYDPKTGTPAVIKDAEAVRNNWPGTVLTYQTQLNGYVADLVSKTSSEGRTWTFTYTPAGDVQTVTDPLGNTTPTAGDYTTVNTYDAFGQLISAKDANGNVTAYDLYHPSGYPTVITDAGLGKSYFTYDDRGNVTEVKNNGSAKVTQAYDAFGRPTTKVEPVDAAAGRFINLKAPVYDPNDNVTTAYAANGSASTSVYDEADQPVETFAPKDDPADPDRRTTTTYDKVGNVLTVTEPQGNLTSTVGDYMTTNKYDAIYQQIEVTNGLGQKVMSEYDNVGNVTVLYDARKTASTDPADFTTKFAYDLNHRVVKTTDALGKFTSARYDKDGLTVGTTDADGNESLAKYDPRGALIESKVPYSKDAGGNITYRTTKYEYDQVGNQTKMITPRGTETANAEDFSLVTLYDALNRKKEEWTAYDPNDSRYTTPDKTFYTYDAVGNLQTVSAPPSSGQSIRNITTYSYYDNGWTKTSTDPWNIVTSYDYNDLGQQTKNTLTAAGGSTSRTMTWEFYPSGNQKARSEDGLPVGKDVVLVDNSDSNNTATQGTWTTGGAAAQYGYNVATAPAGTGAAQFNWQLNIPRDGTYEVFVQHAQVSGAATDAKFSITHSGGTVVKTVNQTQNAGAWISLGSYTFTEDGVQKITLTDQATGKVVADAVKLVRDAGGTVDDERKQFAYRYNPNGMMVEVKDLSPGAKIDRYDIAYDQLNQISSVKEFAGSTLKNTTALTYDDNGNPLTSTHDLTWSKIDYDERDMVAKVTNADSPTAGNQQTSTFTYTARGQLLKQVKPNGNTVDLEYYLDGSTKHQVEKTTAGAVVAEHTLQYTPNGHPSRDVIKLMNADNASDYIDNTYVFTYDPRDRVRGLDKSGDSVSSESYVYDANGNTIEQTIGGGTSTSKYDRDRLHSTTSGGVTSTYNYDPLGRLDTVSVGGQRAQKYYYDGFDRKAKTTAGTGATAKSTTYAYDPFDRTVSQTTASKTTAFTYLGMDNQVLREEVAGKATKSYQYAPWGQQLTQITHKDDGSREYSQFVYRPRGDVVGITKEDGTTRATYGYTAYGSDDESQFTGADKPGTQPEGEEPYNAFRFNAARWDVNSGTYDMGFRNYDPGLNRFLTRDMYGGALADMSLSMNPFTGNRYAFAGGNPISFVELDGHLFGMSWSDIGHAALDIAGMVPVIGEVADVANGIWYLAEGNYVDAALSMASAIPLAGNAVAAAKLAKTGMKVAEGIDTANDARKVTETATDAGRTADNLPTNTPDACPVPNSFVPGTRVLLAGGDSKPIEELQVGDRVAAADVESSQVQSRPVTALITGDGVKHLYTITVDTDGAAGSQTGTLVATDGHPFWLPDAGAWVPAKKLQPGMWLQTASGTWVQVTAVTTGTQKQRVHNLTVDGVHTYYVLAGDEPVLVHNCKVEWRNENDPNFPNRDIRDQSSQDPFPDPSVVRTGGDGMGPLRDGDYHFVVTPSGQARAVHDADLEDLYDQGVWPGHTSLAGFDASGRPNPVHMAGRFTVNNGSITRYDNWSGHYRPQQYGGRMLQDIARGAFEAAGWAGRRLRFKQY
ncbi:MAG: DNRLRE domain-containing protein [Hamadaea sp.]|nr:DNRLRE domain-containing protein [Hamadaea sp.]